MYGLLEGSFRPNQDICVLRAYMRQRDMLVKCSATHIQHMQKALMQMNIQLHHVIATITGVTGMHIIRAIVAGERSAKTLAALRHECCKNSEEVIEQALVGNYREEHVFALRQALELYDIYQSKLMDQVLKDKYTQMRSRPFDKISGVVCRGYSLALQRVMTDFGADESFFEATKKISEHYGINVSISATH